MNLFNRIFNSNNDSYMLAKSCLSKVKTKLGEFADNFPDVTISEILYLNKKWSRLPEYLGNGVSILALEITDNYSTLLAHYENKGFINPHENSDNYELNKIIKGNITNKITGEVFQTGDTFIVDKNERYYLVANEETFIYCMLSPDEDYLTVPYIKPNVLEYFGQL